MTRLRIAEGITVFGLLAVLLWFIFIVFPLSGEGAELKWIPSQVNANGPPVYFATFDSDLSGQAQTMAQPSGSPCKKRWIKAVQAYQRLMNAVHQEGLPSFGYRTYEEPENVYQRTLYSEPVHSERNRLAALHISSCANIESRAKREACEDPFWKGPALDAESYLENISTILHSERIRHYVEVINKEEDEAFDTCRKQTPYKAHEVLCAKKFVRLREQTAKKQVQRLCDPQYQRLTNEYRECEVSAYRRQYQLLKADAEVAQ